MAAPADPSVRFEQCRNAKLYDAVRTGEICSINLAKKLGIFDAKSTFKAPYTNLMTFNPDRDRSEQRFQQICQTDEDQTEARPFCALEHGIGFARKAGFADTCITYECPPGFTKEGQTQCVKPTQDAVVSKMSRCDEQPTDWYAVPNFHLGNGYQKGSAQQCLKPCPSQQMPMLETDPVDKVAMGLDPKDHSDRCILKTQYFGGKYAGSSDHCPLAWVKRLTVTKDEIEEDRNAAMESLKAEGSANEHYQALVEAMPAQAAALYTELLATPLENIEAPDGNIAQACQMINTEDRLQQAYEKCHMVLKTPKSSETLFRDIQGLDEKTAKLKSNALRQACHALFCNNTDDAAMALGKEALCFEDIEEMESDALAAVQAAKDAKVDEAEIVRPQVNDVWNDRLPGIVKWLVILLILSVVLFILYKIVMDFLWPKVLRKPIYKVLRLVFKKLPSDAELKMSDEIAKMKLTKKFS